MNYACEYRNHSLLALQNNLFHQRERLAFLNKLTTVKSVSTVAEVSSRIATLEQLLSEKEAYLRHVA